MWRLVQILATVICACLQSVFAYKPVVLVHGVITGKSSMLLIAQRIATVSDYSISIYFIQQ